MPYASNAQSRYMHMAHPDVAERWDSEMRRGKKGFARKHPVKAAGLPEHVGKSAQPAFGGNAVIGRRMTADDELPTIEEQVAKRAVRAANSRKQMALRAGGLLAVGLVGEAHGRRKERKRLADEALPYALGKALVRTGSPALPSSGSSAPAPGRPATPATRSPGARPAPATPAMSPVTRPAPPRVAPVLLSAPSSGAIGKYANPEASRQRRHGVAQAGLGLTGLAALGYGARDVYDTSRPPPVDEVAEASRAGDAAAVAEHKDGLKAIAAGKPRPAKVRRPLRAGRPNIGGVNREGTKVLAATPRGLLALGGGTALLAASRAMHRRADTAANRGWN